MSPRPESALARVPWSIVFSMLLIPLLGSMNLWSAAQELRPNLYLLQLAWLGIALLVGGTIVRLHTRTLEFLTYPTYVIVNLLLLAVLVFGTAKKGSQRWLDLGVFNLQPSELAKLSIILVTARYFSRYEEPGGYTLRMLLRPMNVSRPFGASALLLFRWWHQEKKLSEAVAKGAKELPNLDPSWLKTVAVVTVVLWGIAAIALLVRRGVSSRRIVAPVDVVFIPFALVLVEPDLGTSLIILSIAAAQILFCGVRRMSLVIAATSGVGVIIFAWNFVLRGYQKMRVTIFLNPESDMQGAGYHSTQSIIAIGSGQLTGKGWGEGTQTQLSFLPENHTDFVFSVLAEEWGFVGGTVLILLFLTLLLLILRSARPATERFDVLVNVGAAAMIFAHVVINIGMVTGLLPVVGVTLPLMSYGGSSMVTQVIAVAFAVNTVTWRRS